MHLTIRDVLAWQHFGGAAVEYLRVDLQNVDRRLDESHRMSAGSLQRSCCDLGTESSRGIFHHDFVG